MTTPPPTSLVSIAPRALGDATVAPIGFGCWRFTGADVDAAGRLLDAAIDAALEGTPSGTRLLVDTADVYGLDWGGAGFGTVETLLGDVLAADPGRRDHILLATKGGIRPPVPYDSSPEGLAAACADSRRRLRVDTIDLYLVHRPDLFTAPSDLAATLESFIDDGFVRAIGVSNMTVDQYDALAAWTATGIAATQPEWSVAHLDPMRDGTLDRAMRDGVTPLAWSPLAGGRVLSGEGLRPELMATLDAIASREGVDRATVALAFLLAHPSDAVPIVGTQRAERFAALVRGVGIHLDRADCYRIIETSEGVRLP
jgi:aryl-alcohol dehydrogenase-like predicted oxidoreductase